MKALTFLIIYLAPLQIWRAAHIGGWSVMVIPFWLFILMPLWDTVVGINRENPTEDEEKELLENKIYRVINWIGAPLQVATVVFGAYAVTHISMSFLELVGFTLSVGISSSIMGINGSHELLHKVDNKLEPLLSRFNLASVCYLHWGIEHLSGHHRNVATPEDPATGRFGQSFYQFLPQTLVGTFTHSWKIETLRLSRKNTQPWTMENRILRGVVLQAAFALGLWIMFGFGAVVFFLIQSFIAVFLLEEVNYIEHYGLERKKIDGDRYEKVTPRHSWNWSNWLTNHFLFNLQRHPDHHFNASRRYQVLRYFDESPLLPTGYAGMLVLALFPSLWRKIMDTRVLAYREKIAAGAKAAGE